MAEPRFSSVADGTGEDDLPRTLRREREAQARRAREADAVPPEDRLGPVLSIEARPPGMAAAPPRYGNDEVHDDEAPPATVTRLEIPFFHLMGFFLKAVIAAIPALVLLLALLWLAGEILTATFPDLIKMQILIRMPN